MEELFGRWRRKTKTGEKKTGEDPVKRGRILAGKVHHIGSRPAQEDCMCVAEAGEGVLLVVADGMGGLADGEVVSGEIVKSFLDSASRLKTGPYEGILRQMTDQAVEKVNQMLGEEKLNKCGSTMVAAFVAEGRFQWISVGDSRIYLYRDGSLRQLNEEHNYKRELIKMAALGEISLEEVENNPQKEFLTSFIGMGSLRYVDASEREENLCPGDRLLLVTDGIYRSMTDEELCKILEKYGDVSQAAAEIRKRILKLHMPYQDNFTAIILDCDPVAEGTSAERE